MSFGPNTLRIRKCWIRTPITNSTGIETKSESRGAMPNWLASRKEMHIPIITNTAWATVSKISLDPRSGFHQRSAGVFLREYAGEITVLPLHADGAAVDVLAIGPELHLAARRHRRKARGEVERRQRLANLLRIGGCRAFQRVSDHEGL